MKKGKITADAEVPVENVDMLARIIEAGGGKLNRYGDLVLELRKSLLSPRKEKYVVEFGILRRGDFVRPFFSVRTDNQLEPVLLMDVDRKQGGKTELKWKCVSETYKKVCDELVKILKRGLTTLPSRQLREIAPAPQQGIRKLKMSEAYSSRLDGFAEVTLANAILKYPIRLRYEDKLKNLQKIETFLREFLYRVEEGKYIIAISGEDWRLVIGVNTYTGEYTPSFISWRSNERYLGEAAISRLKKINPEERVTITVYKIPESSV